MKNVIAWIKTNPISVVSFALMLLSLGVIAYFLFVAKPPVLDNASTTADKAMRDAKNYMNKTIDVPPLNADDPPEQVSGVTINPATIRVMSTIYEDLNRESTQTFESAKAVNRPGHEQMIPDLFPEADLGKAFQARSTYTRLLEAMVGGPRRAAEVSEAIGVPVPYLNAGPPLSGEHITRFLAQQAEAYQQETGATRTNQNQAGEGDTQLQTEQRRQLVNELLRHAQGIHLYATPDLGNAAQPNDGFPLRVASLGVTTEAPTPSQLWEGQLELWVLGDIVRAIGLVNDVNKQRSPDSNVLNAPVKRLLDVEVLSGYVGLHNTGGVDRVGEAGARGATSRASRGPGGYSPPAGGMTDQSAETPLSDNFAFGPTGRSSNHLFDVRHVRVLMHADFQRLPEFFNALARVNLMTPLNMRVTALDEYQLLAENYIYGQGDVVEVEMIIETLWLRDWTAELMPEDVKVYVGLADPPEDATMPLDGGYGEFGGYGDEFGGYGEYGGY